MRFKGISADPGNYLILLFMRPQTHTVVLPLTTIYRKKEHGPKLYEMRLGEGQWNLGWKSEYSLEQTNGGRGCLKGTERT
jgi:hypothetical protein